MFMLYIFFVMLLNIQPFVCLCYKRNHMVNPNRCIICPIYQISEATNSYFRIWLWFIYFFSQGWTPRSNAFLITCSSRRRTPCSSSNSILPYNLHVPHGPAATSFYHSCGNFSLCHSWPRLDLPVHIYDIVADCSDNVPTRYLVNDACVLSGKPLVSASALRLEGQVRSGKVNSTLESRTLSDCAVCVQLTVYNYRGGPCYRCLYPLPPPPETVTNCSDGGVLGVGGSPPLVCPQ